MIEITQLDSTIKLDVRYATNGNFMGRIVYPAARVFLQPVAAEAVVAAHRKLNAQRLGLALFDGYRPWTITKLFWEVTNDEQRKFVADPQRGSKHNRGCAVDLSLFDLSSGDLLPMPSGYDEFTERASPDYLGGTAQETANRDLLRESMEAEGFIVNPREWWHFDHADWEQYEICDLSFDEVADLSK
ncbi:MAG: M15 family metallopeptidase [Blastocatellia bacterium]|nr:M15 family metallopeptidase [Blastocatellia bacterium]